MREASCWLLALALVVGAAFMLGCGDNTHPEVDSKVFADPIPRPDTFTPEAPACERSRDCGPGYKCRDGECEKKCHPHRRHRHGH